MVKEKQTRTYDRDGYRRRAACLCVRSADESEVSPAFKMIILKANPNFVFVFPPPPPLDSPRHQQPHDRPLDRAGRRRGAE